MSIHTGSSVAAIERVVTFVWAMTASQHPGEDRPYRSARARPNGRAVKAAFVGQTGRTIVRGRVESKDEVVTVQVKAAESDAHGYGILA